MYIWRGVEFYALEVLILKTAHNRRFVPANALCLVVQQSKIQEHHQVFIKAMCILKSRVPLLFLKNTLFDIVQATIVCACVITKLAFAY